MRVRFKNGMNFVADVPKVCLASAHVAVRGMVNHGTIIGNCTILPSVQASMYTLHVYGTKLIPI